MRATFSGLVIGVVMLSLIIFTSVGYGLNIYKLIQCDFEAPYKAEVIRIVGLLPAVGCFGGYLDFGK